MPVLFSDFRILRPELEKFLMNHGVFSLLLNKLHLCLTIQAFMEATALITENTRTAIHSSLPINASPLQLDKKNPWKQNRMLGKTSFL